LRELHEALAGFPGDLAPVREIRDWLARLLDSPGLAASDTDPLRARLEALTPAVFESALPAQALHGDASLSNVLRTRGGLVWNDFEDVCFGPVEVGRRGPGDERAGPQRAARRLRHRR
jgi:Ser/Thr protein kinase RdoA (MazF antagonist)